MSYKNWGGGHNAKLGSNWKNLDEQVLSHAIFAMQLSDSQNFYSINKSYASDCPEHKNKSVFSNSTLVLYCIYSLMTQ